jgi:hypothetical protein
MGFLSGFITGAAESIDKQLQKDIERSQERAEGMAQYRITRRRAALEEQQKEKEELKEVLGNLASLVDGDVDKAAQLYISGGENIEGGKSLYQELKKNADAGIDIKTAITFAESRAKPGQLTDYVSEFVTPIKALPAYEGEMKASGLYGAIFKPDLGKQVMREVEEAAPLPKAPTVKTDIVGAKIDRTGFLAAKEYAETAEERERKGKRFEMEVSTFQTAQKKAAQSMELAKKADERADKLQASNASQQEIENARADAAAAREQARLDLATAKAEREAEAFVSETELRGLTIETRRAELDKLKNEPQYATFERMLVHADEQLAKLTILPEDKQDKRKIAELTAQRNHAIKGIKEIANADDTDTAVATFSKQSVDSIINAEIKRQLQPVGLVKDIEGQLEYVLEGNEVKFFDRMTRALDNVELRVAGINDAQMNNAIKAQRDSLKQDAAAYKKRMLDTEGFRESEKFKEATKDQLTNPQFAGSLKAGDIVQYKNAQGAIITVIWTGSRYI